MSGRVKRIYEVGQQFGWLTVLGEGNKTSYGSRRIRVKCRCGRIYDVSPDTFKRAECKCHWCSNKIKAQMRSLDLVGITPATINPKFFFVSLYSLFISAKIFQRF